MTSLPIEIPEGFIPLVTEGDIVTAGQIIAKKEAPQDEIVNILQGLNIPRKHAKKVLKKSPGERINPGDIIAIKKNWYRWHKSKWLRLARRGSTDSLFHLTC